MDTSQPNAEISWSSSRFAGSGLRTRFRPRGRIRPLFFTLAPLLDVVLLVVAILFSIRGGALMPNVSVRGATLTPGTNVELALPDAPFLDGSDSPMVLVVTKQNDIRVFFDENRYDLSLASARDDLARAVARRLEAEGELPAILFVDRKVPYDSLADLLTLLREAGVPRVCFATKPR